MHAANVTFILAADQNNFGTRRQQAFLFKNAVLNIALAQLMIQILAEERS